MASSSTGIFDAISGLWDDLKAQRSELYKKQDAHGDNSELWEELQSAHAQACVNTERKVCEVAGIPCHEWAHNVHSCARSRGDRQTMDMAKGIMDQSRERVDAHSLLCFAMMNDASSPYYELVWGREPEYSWE